MTTDTNKRKVVLKEEPTFSKILNNNTQTFGKKSPISTSQYFALFLSHSVQCEIENSVTPVLFKLFKLAQIKSVQPEK